MIEQFAYSDTWSDGTASYLAMITPRLILMRSCWRMRAPSMCTWIGMWGNFMKAGDG